jgi:Cof subfamily protein (haloacid dehalogenase superfamily)
MIISCDHQIENPFGDKKHQGLFIMDLDGTLLRSDRTFADRDLDALKRLGDHGIIRTIATGRSPYSLASVAISKLPLDFVIFSTGAGVFQHPGGRIIRRVSLEAHEVNRVCAVLRAARLDFMVHRPIPDNHMFAYIQSQDVNEDFERRLSLYRPFAFPMAESPDGFGPATQLLAVVPPQDGLSALKDVRSELSGFNVIQTTSPLDGKSTWIEIFPAAVSKSLTAAWLAEQLRIDKSQVVAVGNDYNDLDLLEWSGMGYVVANAPADMKNRFAAVASNNQGGVAEAVERCLLKAESA